MNKYNFRESYERVDAIKARLNEMADALRNDKQREDFSDAEKGEKKQLMRELSILEAEIAANTPSFNVEKREDMGEVNRQMREAIKGGQRFEVKINRAVASFTGGNASGYADAWNSVNPFPITTGDIVEPLYAKTILSAVGSPLLTGLKGNYQWPVVEAFDAAINDEGVALGDTQIPLSKLVAKPERIGVAVPITREALNETDDLLQTVCTQYMPVAVATLMNKIMFSSSKVANATNLVGPYVDLDATHKKTYSGDAPTLAELLALKATVLGADIQAEQLCYVMTEETKALLEATPKWAGAAQSIVDENGRINGVPVFTTSAATQGDVMFGAFKYAPQGLFGDMSIIVDPYTQARKNAIDFVLNADYAITVLRKEAFAILSKATSSKG